MVQTGAMARAPRLRLLAVVLVGGVLAASCASTGYHYVKNSDDKTYFKVPDDWKLYDHDTILDAAGKTLTPREKQSQLENGWRVAFDGSPKPSLKHLLSAKGNNPSGVAVVLHLAFEEQDAVSLQDLRNFFFEIDSAAQNQSGEVISYEPLELDGGFHGIHIVASIEDDKGRVLTFNQKALLNQASSTAYLFVVACEATCYDHNEGKIDRVVDSWTVRD